MRHSTSGLVWCWQTEALLYPSKVPELPELVLVTLENSSLSGIAVGDW